MQSTLPVNPEIKAKHPTGNNRGLSQAYDIRDIAAEQAIALQGFDVSGSLDDLATRAKALRDLTTVWRDASDRIRILRGRPLPGSRRPEPLVKKKKPQPLPPVTES